MNVEIRELFLAMLRAGLSEQTLTEKEKENIGRLSEDQWKKVLELCNMQNMTAIVNEALKKHPEVAAPAGVKAYLKQAAQQRSVRYYQMIAALRQILKLLKEENITYYVLKGVGLNTMYPREELRSFGDIDLYIPKQEDLEKTHRIFTERGCEVVETYSDNHTAYVYKGQGVTCEVEVHWRMTAEFNNGGLDQQLEQIYRQLDGSQYMTVYPMQQEVRILPPDYNAIHLLAHMLQHLMYTGFGLKLFADWTVFWQKCRAQVDAEPFMQRIKELHIENFLYAVTFVCVRYLGLPADACPWLAEWEPDEELIEALLKDVFEGGEHGKCDSARMIITTRKPSLKTYMLELHRQMKRRFRKIGNCVILWPILWLLTGIIFIYNNKALRNVSTKEIMDSNKQRNTLVQKLNVFREK